MAALLPPDSQVIGPVADTPSPSVLKRFRSFGPRLVASLAIAAVLIWVLQRGGLPVIPGRETFVDLSWSAVFAYLILTFVATALRTYRWVHLLRPVRAGLSTPLVFGISLVGFGAVVFAPLRAGEVVRPWLAARDTEVSFMQASGTVAAERILDGLILTIIMGVSLALAVPLSPLPDHIGQLAVPVALVPAIASSALVVFGLAFCAMAAFYFFHDWVQKLLHLTLFRFSPRLAEWAMGTMERVADGFRFLPSRRHGGAFVRDTLGYWIATAAATWLLLEGTGASADVAQTCVIMGVMGLGSLLPSAPGFFGTYQLGAYCGLALFFPESTVLSAGAAFVFLSYTIQLAVTVVYFVAGLMLMARVKQARA